ncbi:hypothetical protein E2320_005673 [Naja naja]|nr:hypothetical protein E2320_005673 [Naja naja]
MEATVWSLPPAPTLTPGSYNSLAAKTPSSVLVRESDPGPTSPWCGGCVAAISQCITCFAAGRQAGGAVKQTVHLILFLTSVYEEASSNQVKMSGSRDPISVYFVARPDFMHTNLFQYSGSVPPPRQGPVCPSLGYLEEFSGIGEKTGVKVCFFSKHFQRVDFGCPGGHLKLLLAQLKTILGKQEKKRRKIWAGQERPPKMENSVRNFRLAFGSFLPRETMPPNVFLGLDSLCRPPKMRFLYCINPQCPFY